MNGGHSHCTVIIKLMLVHMVVCESLILHVETLIAKYGIDYGCLHAIAGIHCVGSQSTSSIIYPTVTTNDDRVLERRTANNMFYGNLLIFCEHNSNTNNLSLFPSLFPFPFSSFLLSFPSFSFSEISFLSKWEYGIFARTASAPVFFFLINRLRGGAPGFAPGVPPVFLRSR